MRENRRPRREVLVSGRSIDGQEHFGRSRAQGRFHPVWRLADRAQARVMQASPAPGSRGSSRNIRD